MDFTVPKFIERKPRIVGPLTFQQFAFIGAAGIISFFLYFVLPLGTFIIATSFLIGVASAFAFVKINKTPLPIIIKNLFVFIFKPKIYLWKKKISPPKIIEKPAEEEVKIKGEEEQSGLKIGGQSRLKNLSTKIEMKSK